LKTFVNKQTPLPKVATISSGQVFLSKELVFGKNLNPT
jgi:hypothetical protein